MTKKHLVIGDLGSGSVPESDLRSGSSVESLRAAVLAKLAYAVGKTTPEASPRDWFLATALAVRDRIVQGWQTVPTTRPIEGAPSASITCRWSSSSAG